MDKVKIIVSKAVNLEPYVSTATEMIAPRYAEKYNLSKLQKEANQAIATGLLLRKYLGICRDEQLIIDNNGKPRLKSGDVFFNLSHSNEFVALAVANQPVGIDIEQIAEVCWPAAKKVFSREQYEKLHDMDAKEQRFTFTKLWTSTEAVLKLTGTGFTMDPSEESFGITKYAVKSIPYDNYIITYATYKDVDILFEEAQLIKLMQ